MPDPLFLTVGRLSERYGSIAIASFRCSCHRSNYAEAEPLYTRALVILERALGLEHPTLRSV